MGRYCPPTFRISSSHSSIPCHPRRHDTSARVFLYCHLHHLLLFPPPSRHHLCLPERLTFYVHSVVIKVGMVGDSQIGKTSLMVKYVEGSFDEDYIQTLGVNFMEKTITVRRTTITFSIWDLGGQREVCIFLPILVVDKLADQSFGFHL